MNCPDCSVAPGAPHLPGCDVEQCSACGQQKITCQCTQHDPQKALWDGEWPGSRECRSRGWWCVERPRGGYGPCTPSTPGAVLDFNRLAYFQQTGKDALYTVLDRTKLV